MILVQSVLYRVSSAVCLKRVLRDQNVAIPYGGKLSKEKTFVNFAALWLFAKVFSVKFGDVFVLWRGTSKQSTKVSPRKSYFLPIRESFLPQNFPTVREVDDVLCTQRLFRLFTREYPPLAELHNLWSILQLKIFMGDL